MLHQRVLVQHWVPAGSLSTLSLCRRRHKQYAVVPTPLTRLCWWRVVLVRNQAAAKPLHVVNHLSRPHS